MKPRQRNLLIIAVVAALVAASVYYVIPPGEKTHLGLDLQGGLQVVFEARTTDGQPPTTEQMSQTLKIINRRVNGLGVSEAAVQREGSDRVSVGLPGETNPQRALDIIGKTAQLQFFDDGETRLAGPVASREELLKDPKVKELLKPYRGKYTSQAAKKYLILSSAPGSLGGDTGTSYFLYKDEPAMTGAAIKSARQSFDQTNSPDVTMDFTSEGAKQFGEVTKKLATRGALEGQPQTFAIVLDNVIESDPMVDYKENPNGIQSDSAMITGKFTIDEAKDLALVLNTGALPVTLEPIMNQQVSATLGKDSLNQGLIAALAGFGIVLLYMLVYYRFLGLIADIALLIYGVMLWGLFNAIPVTLTLPGVAGMILTIGVAADANVVIFERIKEEVRHGKSVRSAVNSGYARGFHTILDANVLTLLTALVLFGFATAQPKGFAFTLILGVLVSMLTAVLATRAMLGLLANFSFFNRPELMGVHARDVVVEAPAPRAAARRPAPAPVAVGGDGSGAVAVSQPPTTSERPARKRARQRGARKKRK